jgi:hypothetical protein
MMGKKWGFLREMEINGPNCFKLVIDGGNSSMGLGKV